VAAIVAGAGVVGKFGAEGSRQISIFVEEGMPAVTIAEREGDGSDVLGDPVGIASLAVERGQVRRRGGQVGDGSWEPVLKDARWGDWGGCGDG
jgi:hypothetical protein